MCCHCEDFFVNVSLILALCVLFWHKERTHSFELLFGQLFCRVFIGKCSSVDIASALQTCKTTPYPRKPCGRVSMWLAVVCKQKPDYELRQFVTLFSRRNTISVSTVAKPIRLFCYYKKKKIVKKKSCNPWIFYFCFFYIKRLLLIFYYYNTFYL